MIDRTNLIRSTLAEHGRVSAATSLAEGQNLYDAGLTSHASVNVMLALEEHFDVEFPDSLLTRSTFESISNLRSALDTLLEADNSGRS
ncbi:MAG: acyl carrier protein [Ilumatobacteraceae bacterium]